MGRMVHLRPSRSDGPYGGWREPHRTLACVSMKLMSVARPLHLALGLAFAGTLAGCTSFVSARPALAPASTSAPAAIPTVQMIEPGAGSGGTPVKIQVSGTVAEGPLYVATERGYFAKEGISPQFISFDGGQQAIPALSTGQIDIGASAFNAGLVNAINRGIDIRVVAPQSENRDCDHSSTWILVRKDLADRGAVRTPADLRGLKIAMNGTAGSTQYLFDLLLRQGNLQPTDLEYVDLGFGDMGAALG